ncbi:MAG: putative LPS assembly protein LptD [Candidatus Eisenbacteria bacterium]
MSFRNVLTNALIMGALLAVLTAAAQAQPAAPADGFTITADSVEGSDGPNGRVAALEGNVTITRGDATLVGRRGRYYERSGLAIVFGDVRGVDGASTISCDTLRYFRDLDRARLIGNASYGDTSGVTRAERIDVYRRERIAVCSGRAVAVDHEGTFELAAERILYDFDRDEARATGAPHLRMFGEDGEEDGSLTAELIEFSPDDDSVTAVGSAVITTGDVVARARVGVLSGDGDTIELRGDPVVDQDGDLLSGERIRVFMHEGSVSRVIAVGGASASYTVEADDPEGDEQRGHVDGDTLTMYLESGDPVLTTVRGNALSEHEVGTRGERNSVTSREIDVLFFEGRIRRVVFRNEAAGVYTFAPEESPEAPAGQPATAAPDTVELETVSYRASRIDYYVARNRIVLSQGSRIQYKQTVLDADEVVYDPDAQVMTATGSPDLREASDRMAGRTLVYDLDAQSGVIADGVTTFEEGLYSGDTIAREPDGALLVGGGVYTTCSDERPHFRLVSHQMKVYLNDKVIARPLILYVGEIPVFALPFYVFPIRKERHSGFLIPQVELGVTENRGRFIRNFGYYWAPSDYFDLTLWGDYYEQTKWIGHVEGRYKKRYTLSGSVNSSFTEELLNNRRRWDLRFNHRQEIGRHWTAGASGDFRSDASYAQDTYQTIEESVNRSLHSQVWMRGRWSSVSAGVTLDRREQLDQDTVSELLPKVEVTASQRPLLEAAPDAAWWKSTLSKVSYSWDARAVNDRDRTDSGLTVRQAAGVGVTLRGTGKLLGWLSLSPRFNARQNWYDRDKEGRQYAPRLTYDGSVSARTTLYGTFFPGLGPLTAARHIVEPTASLSWTPEFSRYFDDSGSDIFYTLSGFGGTPRKRTALNVSLVNKLQVKLGEGEGQRKIDNLVRLSSSTSYDFEGEGHKWADLSSQLDVRPMQAVSLRWNARHDTEDWSLESTSMTASVGLTGSQPLIAEDSWEERTATLGRSPVDELREELRRMSDVGRAGGRPWDAGLTFRYSRGADPDQSTYWLDGDLALSLTANWRVNYSVHYDVKEQEVASQEYTIYRDLHCWEAQFTRRYYDGEWEYYFRVSVKALPEIQAETGRKGLQRGIR